MTPLHKINVVYKLLRVLKSRNHQKHVGGPGDQKQKYMYDLYYVNYVYE